jgi:hypothetical protein
MDPTAVRLQIFRLLQKWKQKDAPHGMLRQITQFMLVVNAVPQIEDDASGTDIARRLRRQRFDA